MCTDHPMGAINSKSWRQRRRRLISGDKGGKRTIRLYFISARLLLDVRRLVSCSH